MKVKVKQIAKKTEPAGNRFVVTLTKTSLKKLNPGSLLAQVEHFKAVTVNATMTARGWRVKVREENLEKPSVKDGTNTYKVVFVLVCKPIRSRAPDKIAEEFGRMVERLTTSSKSSQWIVEVEGGPPARSTETRYAEASVPKDWKKHFAHLYEREDQVGLVLSAIQAGIKSDWTDRFHVLLVGPPAGGKAQPLTSKILTPTGWKRMGDIKVGDEICHPAGGTSTVEGVFPQGKKRVYQVEFSDGGLTRCCADHLWETETRGVRKELQRRGKQLFSRASVRTTTEVMDTMFSSDGHANHYVRVTEPCQFSTENDLKRPLKPYVLGVLIGNGCFRQNLVRVTLGDEQIVRAVKLLMPERDLLIQDSYNEFHFRGEVHGENHTMRAITDLGLLDKLSVKKFIPREYKLASVDARRRLLQGLMDTDGTVHNGCPQYATSSKRLMQDVVFLVRSLGGVTRVTSKIPTYTHDGERKQGQRAYRISMNLPPEARPFALKRKADLLSKDRMKFPSRSVTAIHRLDKQECQCISVSTTDGLYVTDDFIVTHNTEILRGVRNLLGNDAVLEYDATATTQAGAIKDLDTRAEVPRVMLVEEIEKVDENSLRWLLGVLDHRAEIRKVNFRSSIQKSVKMLCVATVNDYKLFRGMMYGALASRFPNHVWCPRPGRAVLKKILEREVTRVNGSQKWIKPTLDYAIKRGVTDPRRVISICLCGADDLLSGQYQAKLDRTDASVHIRKRKETV